MVMSCWSLSSVVEKGKCWHQLELRLLGGTGARVKTRE